MSEVDGMGNIAMTDWTIRVAERHSSTAAALRPARISALHDHLQHYYCYCDPDLSLCGRDLTGVPEGDFDEASCVVCEAMVDGPYPCCGKEI